MTLLCRGIVNDGTKYLVCGIVNDVTAQLNNYFSHDGNIHYLKITNRIQPEICRIFLCQLQGFTSIMLFQGNSSSLYHSNFPNHTLFYSISPKLQNSVYSLLFLWNTYYAKLI